MWSRGAEGSAAREGLPRGGGGGGASARSLGASRSRGCSITEMMVTMSLWLSSRACQCNNASTLRMGPESNLRFRALEVLAATIKVLVRFINIHGRTLASRRGSRSRDRSRGVGRSSLPRGSEPAPRQANDAEGHLHSIPSEAPSHHLKLAYTEKLRRPESTPKAVWHGCCAAGFVSQRKCQLTLQQCRSIQDPELGSIEGLRRGSRRESRP